MAAFLLWLILLVVCWPLALIALVLTAALLYAACPMLRIPIRVSARPRRP